MFFLIDPKKKGSTELKRLVSIVRFKNYKKRISSSSNNLLKIRSQESPKVQEITDTATTSKASNSSSTSLVNYDSSSNDSDS